MKKRILIFITVLLLLCSAGCSEQDNSSRPNDVSQPENQPTDETGELLDEEGNDWRLSVSHYDSAEDAANMEYVSLDPVFILHDGRFYNLKPTKMTYTDSDRVSERSVLDALPMSSDKLPVLNLAEGDQLVTFSANGGDYAFLPFTDLGTCLPVVWRGGVVRKQMTDIYGSNPEFDIMPTGVDKVIEEINGQTFAPYTGTESGQAFADYAEKVKQADAEFCGVLDSLNISYLATDWSWNNGGTIVQDYTDYIIRGNYGDIVTLGQYQGTKYIEADFTLVNTLYELYPNSMLESTTERTHGGYSVVQIPESISGTYVFRDHTENGLASCYAFLIVR